MDCRTARVLLDYARPRSGELPPSDTADLDRHLNGCTECELLFRTERQLDVHLAAAMQAVPLPEGLHERLLKQLHTAHHARYRRWAAVSAAVVAAAAASVLVCWLAFHKSEPLPRVDGQEFCDDFRLSTGGDRETVRGWFQSRYDVDFAPPPRFDYRLLAYCGMTVYQGKQVPLLVFIRHREDGVTYKAYVRVLSTRDFNLEDLRDAETSAYKMKRLPGEDPGTVYLVVYSDKADLERDFYVKGERKPDNGVTASTTFLPRSFAVLRG